MSTVSLPRASDLQRKVNLSDTCIMSITANENREYFYTHHLWTSLQPMGEQKKEKACDIREKWPCTKDMIISPENVY